MKVRTAELTVCQSYDDFRLPGICWEQLGISLPKPTQKSDPMGADFGNPWEGIPCPAPSGLQSNWMHLNRRPGQKLHQEFDIAAHDAQASWVSWLRIALKTRMY